jgi:hypothetical protein
MKYIRTKKGRIIDLEKFINNEKDTPYYTDFIFDEITKDGHLKWTAVGTDKNTMENQRGRRCQFSATLNSEIISQADTIEELICDDDILYLYDLYPDAVLVVEGKIKPFGYDTAIELKEWLGYKHYKPKFDLFTKDTEGNYIKRAKTNEKGELELL